MGTELNTMDALTEYVVKHRKLGRSFEEIGKLRSIPVEDILTCWDEFLESRIVMSEEEHRVLYELRMEDLLLRCNERLLNMHTDRAEDYKIILETLKQIEEFRGLNAERKSEAEEKVRELTNAQSQLILQAMLTMQTEMRAYLSAAFEQKTIKAIKGTVLDSFDTTFTAVATKALSSSGEK